VGEIKQFLPEIGGEMLMGGGDTDYDVGRELEIGGDDGIGV
jgi:hypothetical protein